MRAGSDRRTFVVHVLEPEPSELHEMATWPTRTLTCVDVHFGPGWLSCIVENPDGSLLKASFPLDLVVEVDELVSAKEVRAARRRLREEAKQEKSQSAKRRPRDPAYK